MDRIDAMKAFTRVVDRRSFAKAAADLGLPRSRASEAVQQLERHLGVRLLARTTRKVTLTAEGEDYHRRCLAILSAIDDADAAAARTVPSGPLRIDVHARFARQYLLPGLPGFLERNPNVQLHIGEGDRLIDLVAEGVDCAIRVGNPADSGLVGRKLGVLAEGTFASPAYLARHGVPKSLDDLAGHKMTGFVSSATRAVIPLEFQINGGVRLVSLPVSVTVSAAATNASLAELGFGLIQVAALPRPKPTGDGRVDRGAFGPSTNGQSRVPALSRRATALTPGAHFHRVGIDHDRRRACRTLRWPDGNTVNAGSPTIGRSPVLGQSTAAAGSFNQRQSRRRVQPGAPDNAGGTNKDGGSNVRHRGGAARPQTVRCLRTVVHNDFDQLL